MAAKAVAKEMPVAGPVEDPSVAAAVGTDLFLIAVPMETYRAIADAAAKRNMTFAQAMQAALSAFLKQPAGPKLLVETKEPTP